MALLEIEIFIGWLVGILIHLYKWGDAQGERFWVHYFFSFFWPLVLVGQVIYWVFYDSEDDYWDLGDGE